MLKKYINRMEISTINDILEYANTGYKMCFDYTTKKYDLVVNTHSVKFRDLVDLYSDRIIITTYKNMGYTIFNTHLLYNLTTLCIMPKNRKKVIGYYINLHNDLLQKIESLNITQQAQRHYHYYNNDRDSDDEHDD